MLYASADSFSTAYFNRPYESCVKKMAVFRSFVLKQKNQKFKPVLRRMLRTSIRCIAGMFRAYFGNNNFNFCYKTFAQNAVPFAATFRCKTGGANAWRYCFLFIILLSSLFLNVLLVCRFLFHSLFKPAL
jgi:hypothetical protein